MELKQREDNSSSWFFHHLVWKRPDLWSKNFFKRRLEEYSDAELAFVIRFIKSNSFGVHNNTWQVSQKKADEILELVLNKIKTFTGITKFKELESKADVLCIELTKDFLAEKKELKKQLKRVKKWERKRKKDLKKKIRQEDFGSWFAENGFVTVFFILIAILAIFLGNLELDTDEDVIKAIADYINLFAADTIH